ncbi:MAG TPA: inositol monophosphatase family protein [Gemmatimonadales bacterium]|nr:inositol monophosphatase family protein [Gemmatimonadales bacterium]
MLSYQHLVDTARAAADAAARVLRSTLPPDPSEWEAKSPRDFVTAVDRAAEEMIRDALLRAEPGSRILGEEFSPDERGAGLLWIVDPLDGTTNYLHGVPAWAVSIGVAVDGELVGGVVHDVPHGVVSHASLGAGAWQGSRRLTVSGIRDPGQALIGTGFPFKDLADADRYLAQFRRVMAATSGIRRPGAASLDLVSVASGTFDGFWELSLAPWDVAAGSVIIREAGGRVTGFDGTDRGIGHGPVVAGNPWIHEWLVTTLRD